MLGGRPRLVRLRAPGVEKAPTLVEGDTPFGSDTPRHPNRDPQGLYLIAIEPRALLLFPRQQQRQRGPAALVGRRLGDLDRARVFLRYSLLDRRESDAHKARALTAHRAEHRRESVAILARLHLLGPIFAIFAGLFASKPLYPMTRTVWNRL